MTDTTPPTDARDRLNAALDDAAPGAAAPAPRSARTPLLRDFALRDEFVAPRQVCYIARATR
jgi:hypothetical protein